MGVKISDIPYLVEIVIADGRARVDDGDNAWYCEIEQLREMRDALDAAIRELEPGVTPTPVTLFALGQVLTGDEDLPIGTVVRDEGETYWTLKPGGWTCSDSNAPRWTLDRLARTYGPVTIVGLP